MRARIRRAGNANPGMCVSLSKQRERTWKRGGGGSRKGGGGGEEAEHEKDCAANRRTFEHTGPCPFFGLCHVDWRNRDPVASLNVRMERREAGTQHHRASA